MFLRFVLCMFFKLRALAFQAGTATMCHSPKVEDRDENKCHTSFTHIFVLKKKKKL